MGALSAVEILEEEEREARLLLEAYRASREQGDTASAAEGEELERRWQEVAARLAHAREEHGRQ